MTAAVVDRGRVEPIPTTTKRQTTTDNFLFAIGTPESGL